MTKQLASVVRRSAVRFAVAAVLSFVHAAVPPVPPAPSVVATVPVVSYGSGAIPKAEMRGTERAPKASGSAKVSAKQGSVQISLSVRGLPAATSFGPEYLTYVLWAVSPEGRPRSLGEIVVNRGKGRFEATTQAQAFGLAVTAEPYFAVGAPSELVVLRNEFSQKAAARAAPTDTKFQAFARGTFGGKDVKSPAAEAQAPLDLRQARNAVRIAKAFGAESYARESYSRASLTLSRAEEYQKDKKNRKAAAPKAREAVQSAEAARMVAVAKIQEARDAAEKADAAARAAEAQKQAEEARKRAEEAQAQAEEAQEVALDQARRRAEAEKSAAAADEARRQSEAEKQALRARLLQQLNQVLETRDSARGLIVNLGEVLFDLDRYTLRPEAREKLAKLSGIVLAHAGLKLDVEGHTDSSGSDEYNQKLSENRAVAVRNYLVGQSVPADSVTSHGFGKTRPVAPNDTADGRQKNRRVEIVVSGDIIGTEVEREKASASPTQ